MVVLFIGAHPDDIELGCGATIHKHRRDWDMHFLTMCSSGLWGVNEGLLECQRAALAELGADPARLDSYHCRPSFMDTDRQVVYQVIRDVIQRICPSVIYTHFEDDHQDHCVIHRECRRLCYSQSVVCYPVVRSQSGLVPNCYEVLSAENVDAKMRALRCYPMYQGVADRPGTNFCFREESQRAKMRADGIYIGHPHVEVFHIQKWVNV